MGLKGVQAVRGLFRSHGETLGRFRLERLAHAMKSMLRGGGVGGGSELGVCPPIEGWGYGVDAWECATASATKAIPWVGCVATVGS